MNFKNVVPGVPDLEHMHGLLALGDLAEIESFFLDFDARSLVVLGKDRAAPGNGKMVVTAANTTFIRFILFRSPLNTLS